MRMGASARPKPIAQAVPGSQSSPTLARAFAKPMMDHLPRRRGGHGEAVDLHQLFVVHRLAQDFARRAMTEERRDAALREALAWVNNAFVGDPQDVRSWSVLDPLAPHVLAVAQRADEAEIAEPTARLFNELGLLSMTKARYAEAEPLMRRALKIDENSYGPDHSTTVTFRKNLAALEAARGRDA
jgi:Tetratricopeptide repeat